jgi:hypothetical protein
MSTPSRNKRVVVYKVAVYYCEKRPDGKWGRRVATHMSSDHLRASDWLNKRHSWAEKDADEEGSYVVLGNNSELRECDEWARPMEETARILLEPEWDSSSEETEEQE